MFCSCCAERGVGRWAAGDCSQGVQLPLDNGSIQSNLPGNIATLPLFLRNGGHFGFGSGAFGQLQANPPAGGVIVPMSMNLGTGGGRHRRRRRRPPGRHWRLPGWRPPGSSRDRRRRRRRRQGQQSAFFPCSLQQGQFSGALAQRIVQDGFILQYGVAVVPQVLGGIPTMATQMGTGFGGLKGNLFSAQQNMQNQNINGNVGVGGKLGGLNGYSGCY